MDSSERLFNNLIKSLLTGDITVNEIEDWLNKVENTKFQDYDIIFCGRSS